jgi:hypothetical protein
MGDCRCHDVEVLFGEWLAGVPQVTARLLSTTLLLLRAVPKVPVSEAVRGKQGGRAL